MGNKHSVNNTCDKRTLESFNQKSCVSTVENTHEQEKATKSTMALSKASKSDLEEIGIRPELAEKLSQEKAKGKLKNLSNVVAVLEANKVHCQVKFEGNFKVEIDETGEIELRFREEDPEHKVLREAKKTKKGWTKLFSSRDGKKVEEGSGYEADKGKAAVKKRKGVEGGKRRKKRKTSEDEDWNIDEEYDNEVCEGKINVNTASEEELDTIRGIGPSLARQIVIYREEHGDFRRLEDVSAIRGISERQVKELKDVLTVGQFENEEPSLSLELINPVAVPSDSGLQHEGREVIHIMSWNLQCFSDEKAQNEGVVETICRAILENGISVGVFQEIGDERALHMIQDELNNPTLKRIRSLKRPNSYWECVTSDVAGPMFRSREYNGFLFDTSRNIELKSHDLLDKPKQGKKQFARRPFLGFFKAKGFDFIVVSVHLKATGLANEDLSRLEKELAHIPDIVTAIKEQIPGERDMVIVGDFNLGPDAEVFDSFREAGLNNLIPHTTFTNISSSNMKGSKCYDNVWISKQTRDHYYTGSSGVLRERMSHPLVPDGWKMGGVVSDHCPVWAEFYCDRDVDKSAGNANVDDIVIESNSKLN